MVWALGLLGAVLPGGPAAAAGAARSPSASSPATGTAAAVTLGLGTLVMPFATMFFSHLLAAMLGFARLRAALARARGTAAALRSWRRPGCSPGLRSRPSTRSRSWARSSASTRSRAATSLRRGAGLRRAAWSPASLPLLAYNLWAFGSLTHNSYADAVKVQGATGHAVLGLTTAGFFGIGMPSLDVALELLFSPRACSRSRRCSRWAWSGIVLLYRRGRRAEALTIGGVALALPGLQLGLLAAVRRRLARGRAS